MSPPLRRALAIRPVNSVKHVVDVVTNALGTLIATVDLARVVDSPVFTAVDQIHVGSAIKAIFLNIQAITIVTVSTGKPSLYMYVLKNPANEINTTNMNPDQVGSNQRRKFVIHQEMLMLSKNSADNFPRTLFKGVVRIPQRYQRMGIDDRLQVVLGWSQSVDGGATADICLQSIYKEFY